jgi:hypothetical protein
MIVLALAASVLAAGVREGGVGAGGNPSSKSVGASAPAAPAPSPARRAKVRIHRGAIESADPSAGTLTLRSAGKGALLTFPVAPSVPLGTLVPGDNVAVTVKDGLATSVRPYRHVPKGLRDGRRTPHPAVAPAPAPSSPPPPPPAPPAN